jgi:UDP-N-acetylmuramoyl-L-alanyl-D-glutamate--2,6-diaminopimelate ligase
MDEGVKSLSSLLAGLVPFDCGEGLVVGDIQQDSRKVTPGSLFVALNGLHRHGLEFAAQAIGRGCSVIIYDPEGGGSDLVKAAKAVHCIPVESLGAKLAEISKRFFDHPSRDLIVVGITGTNGKTSTSHFLVEAASSRLRGAVVGTLGWGFPGDLSETEHTTPDPIEIQRILASLKKSGCQLVAIEASSHGLHQGRLAGVDFKGAVFTNITRDHLDYHLNMEAYIEAKMGILEFDSLNFVVSNADDPCQVAVSERIREGIKHIRFSCRSGGIGRVSAESVKQTPYGIGFDFCSEQFRQEISVPVFGAFNVENLLAAACALLGLGFEGHEAAGALSQVKPVPGRMERVISADPPVVIDYAHTPDALKNALQALREHCEGKLWVVFGCGGDRDKGKRPQMGSIASAMADVVILTDDNPRSEKSEDIIHDIESGMPVGRAIVIPCRDQAIQFAIEGAKREDLILIAGKGHECTQEINGVKFRFLDREAVEKASRARIPFSETV